MGLGAGFGLAIAANDPKDSDQYQALESSASLQQSEAAASLSEAQQQADEAEQRVSEARQSAASAASSVAQREAELSQQEAAVASREQAVSVVEQQIAANTIGQGTWTVGRDIEPGTYRTAAAVSSGCYWSITTTGSNGSDIIQNDIVAGGFPTVTLSVGQDFTTNRCGDWIRQ